LQSCKGERHRLERADLAAGQKASIGDHSYVQAQKTSALTPGMGEPDLLVLPSSPSSGMAADTLAAAAFSVRACVPASKQASKHIGGG